MANETEKCLVDRTGSCTGCGVLNIILEKSRGAEPSKMVGLAERIRETLCTDGSKMIVTSTAKTRQSIW